MFLGSLNLVFCVMVCYAFALPTFTIRAVRSGAAGAARASLLFMELTIHVQLTTLLHS